MKKITINIVLAVLCLNFTAHAQSKPDNVTALKIGDTVPDITINNIINYKDKSGKPITTAKISDFKGKLLILDFWATWCTSCIRNFPQTETLQSQFKDSILILAVAYEPAKRIDAFFKSKAGQRFSFPTVVGDTILQQLFPHRLVPHYAWIGTDGRVKAITSDEPVTGENIHRFLNQQATAFQIKNDINSERPLFLSDNYPEDNKLLHYSLFSQGRYDGLQMGGKFRRSGDVINGRALTNSTVLLIYEAAVIPLFEGMNDNFNDKRLLLDVSDSVQVKETKSEDLKAKHTPYYNYDFIVPVRYADSLFRFMLDDLNRCTGYYGYIEKRKTNCLVLVRTNHKDLLTSKGGEPENSLFNKTPARLTNCPLSYLINRLNSLPEIKLPIIDETGITGNVDLVFTEPVSDFAKLKAQLKPYGLDLQSVERELNTFVLTDLHSYNPVKRGPSN